MARIKGSLTKIVTKRVEKGEIVASEASKYVDADYSRITPSMVMGSIYKPYIILLLVSNYAFKHLSDAKDCDLIIEAIAENMVRAFANLRTYINRFSHIRIFRI